MKNKLIYSLIASIIIGVGGLVFYQYGEMKYKQGYKTAEIKITQETQKEAKKTITRLERNRREAYRMENDAIDNALHDLGILRKDADY